jgi:hypothetical protein
MLDSPDAHPEGTERRGATAIDDVVDVGWDEASVSRSEENARVGGCGREGELDGIA